MSEYNNPAVVSERPPKRKVSKAVIMGVIAVLIIGLAIVLTIVSTSGQTHELDGEYKLTGLGKGGEDYSSYIGYLETDYLLKVDGADIIIEAQGYKTSAKIDQKNHTISSGDFGTVEFTVDGNDITLNLNTEYTMTFTRQ